MPSEQALKRLAGLIVRNRAQRAKIMEEAASAARAAHAAGVRETEIARTLGVNRMTVRRWLGKL